jgi:type II restriction enzyme
LAERADLIRQLIRQWRDDPGATYRSWFLWDERLKNFGSIRRGLKVVVDEIEKGTFGVAYRGSSLETVVHSVAEQRQIFKGADHAFLWKPKLRIPDIYESPTNQRAFGGSVAKIVKLEHAWRRLNGWSDDGFQVAPFPG